MSNNQLPLWNFTPKKLILAAHEVHIWRANLDLPIQQVQELKEILSVDEKLRADKFRFPQHRHRFIVGRGLLRKILGYYLDIKPDYLEFEYSSHGKPRLAESFNKEGLQFNLSHSQGMVLYGCVWQYRIGIDLEYLRSMADVQKIAKRFFSSQEYDVIRNLPVEEKQRAFFRGWTGKEAYLKATGDGLAGSLDQIEISLIPNQPTSLLRIQGRVQTALDWSLYELIPASDYIATLVVEGNNWNLRYWQW